MTETIYLVTIHWGSAGTRKENEPITYSFESERAREAFLNGVDDGVGWMDYAVTDTSEQEGPSPLEEALLEQFLASVGVLLEDLSTYEAVSPEADHVADLYLRLTGIFVNTEGTDGTKEGDNGISTDR